MTDFPFLKPRNVDMNRRNSALTVRHPNEYIRPRSNSTSIIDFWNVSTPLLRTPTPYPSRGHNFVYPSPYSQNELDSPITVVTGKSPLRKSNAGVNKWKFRSSKLKVYFALSILLFGTLIGGILLSKVAPKSRVSCLGDHFCFPSSMPINQKSLKILESFNPEKSFPNEIRNAVQNAKILQPELESENSKIRVLTPLTIPKIVGKVTPPQTDLKNPPTATSEVINENVPQAKVFKPVNNILDGKNENIPQRKSPFMPQASHMERNVKRENQLSDRERYIQRERVNGYYRNSRPSYIPPGVNPRVYDRGFEL